MALASTSLFLSRWLSAPGRVGAVAPSGRKLAERMASATLADGPGVVVELGGGTGAITSELVKAAGQDGVVVVEIDPAMCRVIERRFPAITVVQGDAFRLDQVLQHAGVTAVRGIASGLPLLTQPPERRQALLEKCLSVMEGGPLVQFTYSLFSPIPFDILRETGVRAERMGRVWQNVPPASIWRYSLAA
ncbi:MAG: methyltransferase domain-containing protein [Rhodospirillales bacterium]|nr:methyltransferase domain-containing protein [Rhodospirillales bacterium]